VAQQNFLAPNASGGEAIDLGPGCYDQDLAGAHGTQFRNHAFGDSLRTGVQEGGIGI